MIKRLVGGLIKLLVGLLGGLMLGIPVYLIVGAIGAFENPNMQIIISAIAGFIGLTIAEAIYAKMRKTNTRNGDGHEQKDKK